MKNFTKFTSLMLVLAMSLSLAVTPAFAASDNVASTTTEDSMQSQTAADQTLDPASDGSQAVNVYATVVSTYSVKIPKIITLDGVNKNGSYKVDVNGDIADNETINVTVPAKFDMVSTKGADDKKANVEATLAQDKVAWTWNQMDTDANGTITASGLTAGQWNGTFNFAISLTTAE